MSKSETFDDCSRNLLAWYDRHRRTMPWREEPSAYRVWISEIMLQQTQVATVIPYFERFMVRFPDVQSLAGADQQEVLKAWEGLGYYSRARNLHKGARAVMAEWGGKLPETFENLLKIPGIGPYSAAAIASIAFGEPVAVVDGNVIRVASRLWRRAGDSRKQRFRNDIRKRLNGMIAKDRPGDFNQALMELGALICAPRNPSCDDCPLSTVCQAHQTGAVEKYPTAIKRGKPPHYDVAVAIIVKGKTFLIAQRRQDQMLGGLWELPGGKIESGESPEEGVVRECREELGTTVEAIHTLPLVKHAYTHFSVTLHPFVCELRTSADALTAHTSAELRWISREQIGDFPFPKGTLKVFEQWKEENQTESP